MNPLQMALMGVPATFGNIPQGQAGEMKPLTGIQGAPGEGRDFGAYTYPKGNYGNWRLFYGQDQGASRGASPLAALLAGGAR